MTEPKKLIHLLRTFEEEAADRAARLVAEQKGIELALTSARIDRDLVEALKAQAQTELLSEQELLLVERAAKLAEALATLACQAVEIEAAKLLSLQRQDFVATLTHDLKNPLIGANRLLELFIAGHIGPVTEQQSELLTELKKSNSESLTLINTLSDVYRYETDPGTIFCEEAPLIPIVEASYKEIQNWAQRQNVHTTLIVPDEMQPIYLDSSAIRRLLDNLLGNAMKFAGPDGCVDVCLTKTADEAIIEVHDNGVGIPETERKFLFQRFSQGALGKRYSGGSGLGLYLCKQIAQAHGGKIECLNCTQGTLFRVSLPDKALSVEEKS